MAVLPARTPVPVAASRAGRSVGGLVATALFLLAFVLRLAVVLRSRGGPLGDFGYDSGVYYASADALLHGRLPYAAYTLLHPPALSLVVTPFAALGTATSDHLGFVVANTAFSALGGLNAVLVMLVARRAGLGRAASIIGAVVYAAWPGSIGAEISIRMEPLGNLFELLGLLCLLRAARAGRSGRGWVLAGAAFGAAAVTKIWWIVPLAVAAGWVLRTGRRPAAQFLAGALASAVAVAGPFFVHAPGAMWRMVVTDQLGRPAVGAGVATRLEELASVQHPLSAAPPALSTAVVAVLGLGLLALVRAAWTTPALRLVVVIGGTQLLVLLAAPTYFGFYADYLSPALSLAVAAAVAGSGRRGTAIRRWVATAVIAAVGVGAVVEILVEAPSAIQPFPGEVLAGDVARAHVRCVMADSPTALIELDVLSRTLAAGCPDRIDVSGSTYDLDKPAGGTHVPRRDNLRWQHDLYGYLLSGNAEIVIRHATGVSPATNARLERLPVIATGGGYAIRRTP